MPFDFTNEKSIETFAGELSRKIKHKRNITLGTGKLLHDIAEISGHNCWAAMKASVKQQDEHHSAKTTDYSAHQARALIMAGSGIGENPMWVSRMVLTINVAIDIFMDCYGMYFTLDNWRALKPCLELEVLLKRLEADSLTGTTRKKINLYVADLPGASLAADGKTWVLKEKAFEQHQWLTNNVSLELLESVMVNQGRFLVWHHNDSRGNSSACIVENSFVKAPLTKNEQNALEAIGAMHTATAFSQKQKVMTTELDCSFLGERWSHEATALTVSFGPFSDR